MLQIFKNMIYISYVFQNRVVNRTKIVCNRNKKFSVEKKCFHFYVRELLSIKKSTFKKCEATFTIFFQKKFQHIILIQY